MKKLFFVAIASLVLTSCGCKGWSCQKRYVDNIKKTDTRIRNA